jgi:type II secretory pathway component GspD/PulD (secretin)
MVSSKLLRPVSAFALVGAALLIGGTVVGQPQTKTKGPSTDASSSLVTRVFTLKHTEPAEVVQAINMFLASVAALNPPAPGAGAPAGAGPRPQLVPSFIPGGPGGGSGGVGGFAGGAPPGPAHESRIFLDERTGSIVVRGPDSEVQVAADLVTLLDSPADAPLPDVKSMKAFTLKHATANSIAELANTLNLHVAVLPLDEAKLLVVAGPSEAMRELGDLVKTLDVPAPKAGPLLRKKLFGPRAAS